MTRRGNAPRTAGRDRGELFGPRFELFADVLSIGLATSAACLPLITAPAALSNACTLLRRRSLYAERCTAGRYFDALWVRLRVRRQRRADLAAGGLLLVLCALFVADAGLASAGLPGAAPFTALLAAAAAAAAVSGLRACAQEQAVDDWPAALRTAARLAVRDLPGTALVLLALCTAGMCVWTLPPLILLVPGPLAAALTAVELRVGQTDGC